MVKVDFSEIHGRGVFAIEDIPKGTELTCDVMLFDNAVQELMTWSYPWSKEQFSVCFGFGSFFNHSEAANVKIKAIDKVRLTKTFEITRDVTKGKELFLNYGKHFKTKKTKNYEKLF